MCECEYCSDEKELSSYNFCSAVKMRLIGNTLEFYGRARKVKFLDIYYAPRFDIKYCPMCGRCLNDITN